MSLKNTLILGFGSEMLSDEGLAIRLVKDLKRNWFELAETNTHLCFSLDVVQEIAGYRTLLLIDTLEVAETGAGAVNTFTIESYKPTLHLDNYHDISLKEGIALGAKLELQMPAKVIVITISVNRVGYISNLMSPEIEINYMRILKKVENIINENIYQPVM